MKEAMNATFDAQRKACRYLLSICDVCVNCKEIRSSADTLEGTECLSGDPAYRGPAPERRSAEADGWRTCCPHFVADKHKLYEILQCRQRLHEEEYRAISALKDQLPRRLWR